MSRPELNLDIIDEASVGAPALEEILQQFDQEITAETDRMAALVREIDRGRSMEKHIVSFADVHRPEDFVVRYQGMIRIFRIFGVDQAYYSPATYPDIASQTIHENGWNLDLIRPDGNGLFRVVFLRMASNVDSTQPMNRQTVYCKRR